jgi:hypothetical protein
MTESLDPRNRREYIRRGMLSACLGLACVPVAAAGLIQPELLTGSAASSALAGPIGKAWLAAYLLGGTLSASGVLWSPYPRPELEAAGVRLVLVAMLLNAGAIVLIRGPVAGGLTSIGLIAIAAVLRSRISDLHRAARREPRDRRVRDSGPPDRQA